MGLFSNLPPSRKAPDALDPASAPVRPAMAAIPVKRERSVALPRTTTKKARPAPVENLAEPLPGELPEVVGSRSDEYHPQRPNEYDDIVDQRARTRHVLEKRLGAMREERVAARKSLTKDNKEDKKLESDPPVEKGLPLAQRMMAKMGWKKGDGLGKTKQGIPEPLRVKKTSALGGTVIGPRINKES